MPNPTIPNFPPQGIQAQLDLLYLYNPDAANKLVDQLNAGLLEIKQLQTEVEKALADMQGVLRYKGSVETEADLPKEGNVIGDVWNITSTDENVAWDGTQWDKFGSAVDLSNFLTKTEAAGAYINADASTYTLATLQDAFTYSVARLYKIFNEDKMPTKDSYTLFSLGWTYKDSNNVPTLLASNLADGKFYYYHGSYEDCSPETWQEFAFGGQYLPLTGGTITGDTTIKYGQLTLDVNNAEGEHVTSYPRINFSDYLNHSGYIQVDNTNRVVKFALANNTMEIGTNWYTTKPNPTLGTVSYPFNKTYTRVVNNGTDLSVPTTGTALATIEDVMSHSELPSQTGNAGKVLGTNGDSVEWVEIGGVSEDYLPLSGGQMQDGGYIAFDDSQFGRVFLGYNPDYGSTGFFNYAKTQRIGFNPSQGLIFSTANGSHLGTTGYPWDMVYTTKLNNGADLIVPTEGGTLARIEDINSATGRYSLSLLGSPATTEQTTNIGSRSSAAYNSTSLGFSAICTGGSGVAIGAVAQSTGYRGIALGANAIVRDNSFGICLDGATTLTIVNSDGTIPTERLASNGTAGQVLTKTADGMAWANAPAGTTSVEGSTGYGVHGDYGMHYGIIDSPYGLITQGAGNQLKIAAGIQLCVPGADSYIQLGSASTYDPTSTTTFTLFYARGANGVGATFLEATDVVWSETEPEPNGEDGFQAWWDPAHGLWQMRSNDTGNVWRDIVGCPLCDCKVTDGAITRVDFIGYRVLNKQPTMPMLPTDDGSYVLKCVVSNGTTTLQWVTEE